MILCRYLIKHASLIKFSVDYSTAVGSSYTSAINNVVPIAKSVAQFIDWLKLGKGYLHVIGFDLGGR